MKLRVTACIGSLLLTGSLSAQTLTDVINEFNEGVAKVNNQEYVESVDYFNRVLEMGEAVGDSADDLVSQAKTQIPLAYYRQATLFLKRRQFDNAIPYLEQTIEYSREYDNNEESRQKARRYLIQSYMLEGRRAFQNDNYDQSVEYFDQALALKEDLYQAHQGKGMVFLEQDEIEMMLEEFEMAKEGARAANDPETIEQINNAVDTYFNQIIKEELEMVDPEDNDYTYVIEASERALEANPKNARALYYMALAHNKMIQYDEAIDYATRALEYETDPVWISAINFELGHAYQNVVEYDKACEALKKVTEDPFRSRAERKMGTIPGCS